MLAGSKLFLQGKERMDREEEIVSRISSIPLQLVRVRFQLRIKGKELAEEDSREAISNKTNR